MSRARDLAAFVSNADGDIKFDTDTLFIDSSANRVGISTTTVNRKLEVAGNNNGGSKENYIRITDTDTSATANNQQGGIEFYTSDSGNENVTASIENLYAGSGGGSELTFNTAPNGSSGVSERIRINENGNVHITDNTNGPDAALHIEKTTPEIRLQINGNSGYNWIKSAANNELTFGKSSNEYLRILSAGGLTFNGDTAAANSLSDYENGQWTPTLSATGRTFTLSTNVGRYVKIGDVVHLVGRIDVSSVSGSSTSGSKITGIPYSIPNANEVQGGMTPMQAQWGTTDRVMIYIPANANYLSLYKNDHGAAYSTAQGNDITSGDSIIFSLTYITAT